MNCLDTSDYCKTVVKKIKPTLIWEPKCTKLAIKSHFSIPNNNVQVGCKNDAIRTDEMIVDPCFQNVRFACHFHLHDDDVLKMIHTRAC